MNNIIPTIKGIDNLSPIRFKCTYLFDESCKDLKHSDWLNKMFGFGYGFKNYLSLNWTYNKEMNRIYIQYKARHEYNNTEYIKQIYGCDFGESHDFKIEIERAVTAYTSIHTGKDYPYVDKVKIMVDDKCVATEEFRSRTKLVFITGKELSFYDK